MNKQNKGTDIDNKLMVAKGDEVGNGNEKKKIKKIPGFKKISYGWDLGQKLVVSTFPIYNK